MNCRNCGADNPNEASVCGKCGATLPTIAGSKTLLSGESSESLPVVIATIVGFFMVVAGAWLIGGAQGFGVFLAVTGAVAMMVASFTYAMSEKRK